MAKVLKNKNKQQLIVSDKGFSYLLEEIAARTFYEYVNNVVIYKRLKNKTKLTKKEKAIFDSAMEKIDLNYSFIASGRANKLLGIDLDIDKWLDDATKKIDEIMKEEPGQKRRRTRVKWKT